MKLKTLLALTSVIATALIGSANAADCGWVGVNVKDCVVFNGVGDFTKNFKGPGKYAVRYLNTASWTSYNLYRASTFAYGASSIKVTDINGVDMTGLFQISHGRNSTITGIPVGTIGSDITLIYDVKGNKSTGNVSVKNVCSWSGWC